MKERTSFAEIGVYAAMSTLRAVRRLRPDPIPDAVLERVLEAASWAPTGGNVQPWRVIVVRDRDKVRRLGELYSIRWLAYSKQHMAQLEGAPEALRARTEKMLESGNYLAEHFADTPAVLVFCFNPKIMAITDLKQGRVSVVGGASIALLCDVIFMADTATIADPHVRVGIVAGDGGTAIWPLVLGPARAKQFLLTGDPVTAAEALAMGLVNRVVAPAALNAEALAFAERLAAGAPLAVRYTKQAVNKLVKDALNTTFDTATALEIVTFQSEDHREALAALREKRTPVFKGR